MEYEIADDPQGDLDREIARRDGGLEEDLVHFRRRRPEAQPEDDLIRESGQLQG